MKKTIITAAVTFAAGLYMQDQTQFLSFLNTDPKVYAPITTYQISRSQNVIKQEADGERLVECRYVAPVTADFLDSYGTVVSRELVRRPRDVEAMAALAFNAKNVNKDTTTILEIPNVVQEPRKFRANQYVIVADEMTLNNSTQFVIRTECYNSKLGRFLGRFGPFPIPPDNTTYTEEDQIIAPGFNIRPIVALVILALAMYFLWGSNALFSGWRKKFFDRRAVTKQRKDKAFEDMILARATRL